MAKQPEDTKTLDLIETTRKAGRPKIGKAMSAADRKRAQRARDKAMLWNGPITLNSIADVSTDGLLLGLAECVKGGYLAVFEQITAELKARAQKSIGKHA